MQAIKCELCGSNDIIKTDGFFVCQHCGTKYSVEEARKMMIDGTVQISGTVKVDSSDKLTNLYQIARRAKADNNGENAAKYYEMILLEDPYSWEAAFYTVYFKATECTIGQIQSAAISVSNCIDTILIMIKEKVLDESDKETAVKEVTSRVVSISQMLFYGAQKNYNDIDSQIRSQFSQEYIDRAFAAFQTLYNLGIQLEAIFPDKDYVHELITNAWKTGVFMHSQIISLLSKKESNKETILRYAAKIRKYEPSFKDPYVPTGGCYIATSIYGSYNCPEVWVLRRYRDMVLVRTWYGRAFVNAYYRFSPKLVKWFGRNNWFRKIGKNCLDRLTLDLQNRNYENTPYEDFSESE